MTTDDTEAFALHRPSLVALAYRMLGDMARAEDIIQDAWLRWHRRSVDVEAPKAFLLKIVTRLCLNELASARARREESRGDRLPEPVDLDETGIADVEMLDQISMAFLVVLQRLTPGERAVLLLHDVFDMSYAEIAPLMKRSEAACRQLLSRANENVTAERRVFETSEDEHRQLLRAFLGASRAGAFDAIVGLLTENAMLIVDGGPEGGRVGRIRNVGRPVVGAKRISAFLCAVAQQDKRRTTVHECVLNGQPAVVILREDGQPHAAMMVSVAGGRIRHIFVQADSERLKHLGPLH
jgi:RNA polymerase sigma-70 factor, ECF subfamily